MAEQGRADPEVGTRVRMKETGRTGTVLKVLETRGRTLNCVVYDRTAREGPVPLVGETVGEFAVYADADTFEVLP